MSIEALAAAIENRTIAAYRDALAGDARSVELLRALAAVVAAFDGHTAPSTIPRATLTRSPPRSAASASRAHATASDSQSTTRCGLASPAASGGRPRGRAGVEGSGSGRVRGRPAPTRLPPREGFFGGRGI